MVRHASKCAANQLWLIALVVWVTGCIPNNPYPASEHTQEIYYSTFSEEPKHLAPSTMIRQFPTVRVSTRFIQQIYEPPLGTSHSSTTTSNAHINLSH